MGEVTSRCVARDRTWRIGTEILIEGPVKSNLISHELLQDLPRGESRIQLLPDKDPWQNWGCNVGPYGASARVTTEYRWPWVGSQQNDANAVQPRKHPHQPLEIRKSQAFSIPAIELGSELIILLLQYSKYVPFTTRDCRDLGRLKEQGRACKTVKLRNG